MIQLAHRLTSKDKAMAKKIRKSTSARKRRVPAQKAKGAVAPSVASLLPKATPEKMSAAAKKFVEGVLERGEAVPAGEPLPPGATHEIVGVDKDGTPIIVRRRYSMVGSKPATPKKLARSTRKKQLGDSTTRFDAWPSKSTSGLTRGSS